MPPDYYKVLGVAPGADNAAIKKAYKATRGGCDWPWRNHEGVFSLSTEEVV